MIICLPVSLCLVDRGLLWLPCALMQPCLTWVNAASAPFYPRCFRGLPWAHEIYFSFSQTWHWAESKKWEASSRALFHCMRGACIYQRVAGPFSTAWGSRAVLLPEWWGRLELSSFLCPCYVNCVTAGPDSQPACLPAAGPLQGAGCPEVKGLWQTGDMIVIIGSRRWMWMAG